MSETRFTRLRGAGLLSGALLLGAAALPLESCTGGDKPPAPEPAAVKLPPPSLRRLTQAQYKNTVHDVFGDDIVIAGGLEPDVVIGDFASVGASETSISPRGVEQYESLAYDIAQQALTGDARRAALVPCKPASASDAACAKQALEPLGRRLLRRPLTADETQEIVQVATTAGDTLKDFWAGLQFGIATLLQSPDFLFRVELGAPAADGARLTGYELASRLAYFLWNGPPDDALLDAAGKGALDTSDGVAAEVKRMLDSPRARRGLRAFATDWLQLAQLDDLVKDPTIYTQASPDVGPAAREETLRDIERIAFDLDGDVRDLLTTRETFVNRKLASIYGVRAPSQTDFALTTLPEDQPRRGLLGQLALLAPQAHPTTTSPTLRGKFIRTILLCQSVPPPPANFNTAIPAATEMVKTMRQRLTLHNQDTFCASCHKLTDPIGLGLEQFDGLGVLRATESGEPIDASGELDGATWKDAAGLAQVIRDHRDFVPCLARRTYRYATGHIENTDEVQVVAWLADRLGGSGFKMKQLLSTIATSETFRRAGATTPGK